MQILIKIAFVLLPIFAMSQISFYRNYADNGYDFGQGIVQLEDSSYVVTGTSGSFASHAQAFLMHVDSNGTRLWSNHFGGQESEWGKRVLYKENVGYFLCGHSNSFGAGDYDFYLVKVNSSGLEEWSKTYGNESWERVMDAALTRDTGVIMVGEKDNGMYGTDMYLVRTNINGDTLWTRTFEHIGDDIATSVDVYRDSIFYVGGTWYDSDSLQSKGIIYKILDDGTMLDTLSFSNYPGEYELNDLHVIGDTVQALGSQRLNNADQWDYTFYRAQITVNGFGNVSCFNSTVGGDWHGDVFTSYGNNSTRYMGMSFENNANTYPGGRDVQVQRGNNFMFFQDGVAFLAYEEPDVNGEIIRTSDGGAILVGYHQFPLIGSGGGTIFLLKIGPNELYPVTNVPVVHSALVNVEEQQNLISASVYPNPATTLLHIELPTNEEASYRFYDFSGKVVTNGRMNGTSTLSLQDFQSGIYLLEVQTQNGKAINRVIIQ